MSEKMVGHTPGPWKIHRKPGRSGNIEAIGPCGVEEYAGSAWLEVSEEDARLIVAAPDLLAALKLAKDHSELEDEVLDIVNAAIAKAEGKSS